MHDLFAHMRVLGSRLYRSKQEAMHAKVMPKAKCTRAVHIGCPQRKAIGTLFTLTDRVPQIPRVPGSAATIDMDYFFRIAPCLGRPTASERVAVFLRLG